MSARVSDERLANLLMEIADDPMPGCDNDDLALDLRDTRAALRKAVEALRLYERLACPDGDASGCSLCGTTEGHDPLCAVPLGRSAISAAKEVLPCA